MVSDQRFSQMKTIKCATLTRASCCCYTRRDASPRPGLGIIRDGANARERSVCWVFRVPAVARVANHVSVAVRSRNSVTIRHNCVVKSWKVIDGTV